MEGFSIIICTYNRAELLRHCLESFTKQTIHPVNVEFIVVNNDSTDNTEEVVAAFVNRLPSLQSVVEKNIGLSYARNRGIEEAKYDWVCYMDDDAKAYPNFLERMFFIRNNFSFDGFGGMFYPWYRLPKPKWLPSEFGQMTLLRPAAGPLQKGKTVAGGICAFNKERLIKAGMFPVDIGMRGNIVGYGEESFVQEKLWEEGAVIGFDPEWKIDHLVAEYKYHTSWHLKRNFGKGRDFQISKGALTVWEKIMLWIRAIAFAPLLFIKFLPKLLLNKKYYRENYFLDSLSYSYKLFGRASV